MLPARNMSRRKEGRGIIMRASMPIRATAMKISEFFLKNEVSTVSVLGSGIDKFSW
jgi:hypothetical protein